MAFASKEKSRIKMVALTINGVDNITWYSPIKSNNRTDDFIINGMLRRFEKNSQLKYVNKIQFYDNLGDQKIIREFQIRST